MEPQNSINKHKCKDQTHLMCSEKANSTASLLDNNAPHVVISTSQFTNNEPSIKWALRLKPIRVQRESNSGKKESEITPFVSILEKTVQTLGFPDYN